MFDSFFDLFDGVDDIDDFENGDLFSDINTELDIPIDENLEFAMDSNEDIQVLYALDRMTNEIDGIDDASIDSYLSDRSYSPESWQGLVNNWKGIYGEIKVADGLNDSASDLNFVIPASTSNPGVDIYGLDDNGNISEMYQVKMTEDADYISKTLNELPEDVKIICPSEVASEFDDPRVVDAGFTHGELIEDIDNVSDIVMSEESWEEELYADDDFNFWIEKRYAYV